jgi:uncharacterized membrane protein required for colicin V production
MERFIIRTKLLLRYSSFIASICYAVNVNLIKKHLHDLSPLSITGNFMVLFVPAFIVLFSLVFFEVVQDVKVQESVLFIMVLGVGNRNC